MLVNHAFVFGTLKKATDVNVFMLTGFSESAQMALFQILAAILHLSNVEVKGQSADSSSITVGMQTCWSDTSGMHPTQRCCLISVPCNVPSQTKTTWRCSVS